MPHSQLFIAQHWLFIVLLAFENSSEGLTWSGKKRRSEETASLSLMTVLNAWSSLFHDRSYGVHKIYGGRRREPSCVGSPEPLYAVHCIIALVTPFLRAAGRTIVCLVAVPPFLCPHYFFSSSSENGWEGGIYELFSRPTGHTLPFHSFFPFSFFMAQLTESKRRMCVASNLTY